MSNPQTQQVSFPTASPNLHQNKLSRPLHSEANPSRSGLLRSQVSERLKALRVGNFLWQGLSHMPLACEFLLELRSLAYRMRLQYKRHYRVYGIDLGPCHQMKPSGHPELNMRTLGCIADIENFGSARPWATTIDLEVYRDAWAKGAEWVANNSCKSMQEIR